MRKSFCCVKIAPDRVSACKKSRSVKKYVCSLCVQVTSFSVSNVFCVEKTCVKIVLCKGFSVEKGSV